MGTRASDKVKEIDDVRSGLDAKLVELERRLPPLARAGRKAVAIAVGGGVGSAALAFAARRVFSKRRSKPEPAALVPKPIVVNVLPKGAVAVAAAGVAVWAGVRIYEALQSSQGASRSAPAVVTPIPDRSRTSGA